MTKIGNIVGTKKNGFDTADLFLNDKGGVSFQWKNSGEVVKFVSEKAFDTWADTDYNTYISVINYL